MAKNNKVTLLKGEGAHQHTLYGNFAVKNQNDDFFSIAVKEESDLRHELPNGKFGEHNTLKIDAGNWVMGKQVEYNPFRRELSRVFD